MTSKPSAKTKSGKQKSSPELATSHEDPAYIIEKVHSLSTEAFSFIQNSPNRDRIKGIVLERLLADIEALTGKKSPDDCSLSRGTAKDCIFANRVATEMMNIMSATDKCIELIEESVTSKSFGLELMAAGQFIEAIKTMNKSALSILEVGPGYRIIP